MTTADPPPNPTGAGRPPSPAAAEVPDADAQEQGQPVDGWSEEDEVVGATADGGPLDVRPEADALEQAQVVAEEQVRTSTSRPDDVAEADWLEQSIAEPLDEDER